MALKVKVISAEKSLPTSPTDGTSLEERVRAFVSGLGNNDVKFVSMTSVSWTVAGSEPEAGFRALILHT